MKITWALISFSVLLAVLWIVTSFFINTVYMRDDFVFVVGEGLIAVGFGDWSGTDGLGFLPGVYTFPPKGRLLPILPSFSRLQRPKRAIIRLPIWIALGMVLMATFLRWRQEALKQVGHCKCGYNLKGNVTGRCPECGTPVKHLPRESP